MCIINSFRVCGSVFCRFCCKNDLLLYYDEDGNSKTCLIHVVGCPDTEPNVCSYIPVCVICHEKIEEFQVSSLRLCVFLIE